MRVLVLFNVCNLHKANRNLLYTEQNQTIVPSLLSIHSADSQQAIQGFKQLLNASDLTYDLQQEK